MWFEMKYSSKKSITELVALITKEMRQREEQVKRQQDEVQKTKNEFNALSRKDGGNL